MDITNPVLFEVLAARPRRRGLRIDLTIPLLRRPFQGLTRRLLSRGGPDAGSNRRPFPRVGFGTPLCVPSGAEHQKEALCGPHPHAPDPQRCRLSERSPSPQKGGPNSTGTGTPSKGQEETLAEGAGWREFVGLAATAGALGLALLV